MYVAYNRMYRGKAISRPYVIMRGKNKEQLRKKTIALNRENSKRARPYKFKLVKIVRR